MTNKYNDFHKNVCNLQVTRNYNAAYVASPLIAAAPFAYASPYIAAASPYIAPASPYIASPVIV